MLVARQLGRQRVALLLPVHSSVDHQAEFHLSVVHRAVHGSARPRPDGRTPTAVLDALAGRGAVARGRRGHRHAAGRRRRLVGGRPARLPAAGLPGRGRRRAGGRCRRAGPSSSLSSSSAGAAT